MAEEQVERFSPSGGQVTGVAGLVVAAGLVVLGVVDREGVPLWVPALGVLLAVLVWTAMLRPRVWVEPGTLVLRNMVDTTRLPLAAVDEVTVRQVMAVRVDGKRYVCAGTGRTMRQAVRGSAVHRTRWGIGGLRGEEAHGVESGIVYGDYVELRLRDLISEDRRQRGVATPSTELDALAAEVRRDWAWPEIALLALAVGLFAISLVAG